jgi:hypothetical protein
MMAKVTTNVRFKFVAPQGLKKDDNEIDEMMLKFFKSKGKMTSRQQGSKYEMTSYKFNNTEATIRFKVNRDAVGNLKSIDTLGMFDCYRKYIPSNLDTYKIIMDGFLKYLRGFKGQWYIDIFTFRVFPIDFMRQFLSRVGENVVNVYVTITTNKGYCFLKGDRLEYRVNEWDEETMETIENILRRYTRK